MGHLSVRSGHGACLSNSCYIYIHTHTHTHTYIYIHTHTYTHTHTKGKIPDTIKYFIYTPMG